MQYLLLRANNEGQLIALDKSIILKVPTKELKDFPVNKIKFESSEIKIKTQFAHVAENLEWTDCNEDLMDYYHNETLRQIAVYNGK
jgi:hypothetical protein